MVKQKQILQSVSGNITARSYVSLFDHIKVPVVLPTS